MSNEGVLSTRMFYGFEELFSSDNIEDVQCKPTKPILKWAGGKQQLLTELRKSYPKNFKKYIEPFIGGGAVFFDLQPKKAIIGDLNPELINLYEVIKTNPKVLIEELDKYTLSKEFFYELRSLDLSTLTKTEIAARTVFLNRTCFNGLYRVNKKGEFNVPYANYKNPRICDDENIYNASQVLKRSQILLGDYKRILQKNAKAGDFVFLDPPYLPISKYSDFKRYTKEQFYEEDHTDLANEFKRLYDLGCHVVLTNSNHPLIYDLYKDFDIKVIATKRNISCNGKSRSGEDVIITAKPSENIFVDFHDIKLSKQIKKAPTTRFMGSKKALLNNIWEVTSKFEFDSVLDLFGGSGIVSYMFKAQGKQVFLNDYMEMNATMGRALIQNNRTKLTKGDLGFLLDKKSTKSDKFVTKTFNGLYYTKEDNLMIDQLRCNIKAIKNKTKKDLAMTALIRACLKKRPRGIFTYTGLRYNDGRRDLQLSINEQFEEAVKVLNEAVFDNKTSNKVRMGDAMEAQFTADVVYLDPPYYSPHSDNEYVRRYHFLEGLAKDWEGVDMQWETKTKKFKSYPTPFSSRVGAYDAFDKLFKKFKDSILIVSYSSNSLPTQEEIIGLLSKYKSKVDVVAVDHLYSAGSHNHKIGQNKNRVKEYLFIAY